MIVADLITSLLMIVIDLMTNFTLQTLPDPLQNLLLMLVADLITIFTDRIYSLP
jgi:Co/Zn/Cd efflux system component